MNHAFLESASDSSKCGAIVPPGRLCGHDLKAHSNEAECDYCNYIGVVQNDANNGIACPNCLNKVIKKAVVNSSQGGPISLNEVIRKSREIDYGLGIKTAIFNANTTAIQELKEAVYRDDEIPILEKASKIAGLIYDRIQEFQKLIFDKSEEVRDLNSSQRQYQVELNKIANELREDERKKYQAIDLNYKPNKVSDKFKEKTEPKIKKITVKNKIDPIELRNAAAELGIAEFTLKGLCVAQNLTVEQAKIKMKSVIENSRKIQNG